jgi:hypothetical protein
MDDDELPNDNQRRLICELIADAFIELRSINDNAEQVHALAYAFHNLPLEMYGWGTWSVKFTRGRLRRYRDLFPITGPDYVAKFNAIFPEDD